MRTLLLHLDGIEMWKVTCILRGGRVDNQRYEIIEIMDENFPPPRIFSSPVSALAELHALVARDRLLRVERMATRKRRQQPRGWDVMRASWLHGDSAILASHRRSRASAIRALRAARAARLPAGNHQIA